MISIDVTVDDIKYVVEGLERLWYDSYYAEAGSAAINTLIEYLRVHLVAAGERNALDV